MWKSVLSLSSDQKQVFAQLPKEYEQGLALEIALLGNALKELNAEAFFVDETSVIQFIKSAQAAKGDAFSGITLAQVKNATAEVILSEQDMLASIKVDGAYGGDALTPTDIILR
ncbi:predicted polymerase [Vibrio variabilis]|uniref:Predicted polymerase n=1 Tax=Vibrio variabilis TaxID=990271 RepID=A0ABQ0J6T7_9VIBR|nr:predicted polymerase [Vibrio variabilis]